ncbi:MAG: M42 family metallopeptidase [Deltaproteobacteria bacterium]|nr:M42 family metallopeptidase [Deltaproteobacteria bacterium]
MRERINELLEELTQLAGPSGGEEAVREFIAEALKDHCTGLWEDPLGNLVAKVGPGEACKVGVLAHMDEVGFIVSAITDAGLIKFELVGSIDPRCLPGCEVDIVCDDHSLRRGVIGQESRHLQGLTSQGAVSTHKSMLIDVGVSSYQEVRELKIDIGSRIVFATKFHAYPNGTLKAKALDDRIGCAVLIEALTSLAHKLKNTTFYGYFTIQEEIGAKGARVVAFDTRPDLTITVDTVPTKNPDQICPRDVEIKRGPVIRLFDWVPGYKYGMFTHRLIRNRLREVAAEDQIPYQTDVLTSTFLDSSQVHLTAQGIPSGSICIPRRYAHAPVELCHLDDVVNGQRLLSDFILSLDKQPLRFGKKYI